mgnify:CR=1 FL=1
MHIIRAGVKVTAVLGIAFITVLLMAAILYILHVVHLNEDQSAAIRQAANGSSSNAGALETVARSGQRSKPPSQASEIERSMSVSETVIARSDSLISELTPAISTPSHSEISHPRPKHDSTSEAEARTPLAAASAPQPTTVLSPPPNRSSEATSDTNLSSQTVPAPADPRYYTVKQGDTLYSIARQVYGEGRYWKAIYDANKSLIKDPVKLKLAWKLELPPPEKVIPENEY